MPMTDDEINSYRCTVALRTLEEAGVIGHAFLVSQQLTTSEGTGVCIGVSDEDSGFGSERYWRIYVPDCEGIEVFGPEDYGLNNTSVARCDALLRIPTASHRSLNLAQAVNVTASSLRLLATATDPSPPPQLAPARLRTLLVDDLLEVLRQTTYFGGRPDTATRARFTRSMARLQLLQEEVAVARGMLKSIKHRLRHGPEPS